MRLSNTSCARALCLLFVSCVSLQAAELPDPLVYLYPRPNARFVRPQITIFFKIKGETQEQFSTDAVSFQVSGERSGLHSGQVIMSGNTFIFKPDVSFDISERVSVSIQITGIDWHRPYQFFFTTSNLEQVPPGEFPEKPVTNSDALSKQAQLSSKSANVPTVINGVAVPSDFPTFELTANAETAPGRFFVGSGRYLLILENDGTPYFYRKVAGAAADFKLHSSGVLSYTINTAGEIPIFAETMDSNYNVLRQYYCQNGFFTDWHEFQLTPEGTALLIAADIRIVDLSDVLPNGDPNAEVIGNHVQEIDSDNNVVFQWESWDHFEIDRPGDYVHMNSIAVDYDSNLVISSRHQDECTKIDRTTGEIIWRLGGKNNQFTFMNDPLQFFTQHDIRPVVGKPNHYTLFDNGSETERPYSRAVEYKLDPVNMTVEKVWEFRLNPDRLVVFSGNAQRLPNGNTMINWVQDATEVDANGTTVFRADYTSFIAYRAFRFEWDGQLTSPHLIMEEQLSGVRLIFNKFGDDDIQQYNVYVTEAGRNREFFTSTTNTWIDLDVSDFPNRTKYSFNVTAVNTLDQESDFSNTTEINFLRTNNSLGILGSSAQEDASDPEWAESTTGLGGALQFDGNDDFVNCGNDPTLQVRSLTLEAWINATQWRDQAFEGSIITKANQVPGTESGFVLSTGSAGQLLFGLGQPNLWQELSSPPGSMVEREWHHIAATYDGSVMRLFINGQQAGSQATNGQLWNASQVNLLIGSFENDPARSFNGTIDEVRLWNAARNEDDLRATMEVKLSGREQDLIGYWPFEEGTGQTTQDLARDDNLVLNGDFSVGAANWTLNTSEDADAEGSVNADGVYQLVINNGGTNETAVQFKQGRLLLVNGLSYRFAFDAIAESDRIIEAEIKHASDATLNYSKIGLSAVRSRSWTTFEHVFMMEEATDNNATIFFNCGNSNSDLMLDNITLEPVSVTSVAEPPTIPKSIQLYDNYPNPFNPTTTIRYELPQASRVDLKIYNVLGKLVAELSEISGGVGLNEIRFEAENLGSGVYFYELQVRSLTTSLVQRRVKKMLLLR